MVTESTKELMLALLRKYQTLIISQLADHALVGEYLTDTTVANARLLCQMRTIIFLCKTADLLDLQNIPLAEKLYVASESHYVKDGHWLQQLNHPEPANLYSYAFIMLAQSYLHKFTKNPLYCVALAETFSAVEYKFQGQHLFKPLNHPACLEQNSAMHLYEALSFALFQTNAVYVQSALSSLEQELIKTFWQPVNYLMAEKVDFTGKVVSYEAGHWFEWVSLLWRVNTWGGMTSINAADLYQAAFTHTTFTEQGLVMNEMDDLWVAESTQQIRIWPNLEYLRAKYLVGQLTDQELQSFIALFFNEQGLPKEYLDASQQGVKSTTGYHIAECFIDTLVN